MKINFIQIYINRLNIFLILVSVSFVEAWLSTSKARRSLIVGREVGISHSVCRVLVSKASILAIISWTLASLSLCVSSKRRQISLFYCVATLSCLVIIASLVKTIRSLVVKGVGWLRSFRRR